MSARGALLLLRRSAANFSRKGKIAAPLLEPRAMPTRREAAATTPPPPGTPSCFHVLRGIVEGMLADQQEQKHQGQKSPEAPSGQHQDHQLKHQHNPRGHRKVLVLCGPSGVGKSFLIRKLMATFPSKLFCSVSHTTRSPREKERNGIHYHFVDAHAFKEILARGEFLEHIELFGNYYGTTFKALEDAQSEGRICVMDLNTAGVESLRRYEAGMRAQRGRFDPSTCVYLVPSDMEQLRVGLNVRNSETAESFNMRLAAAAEDIRRATESRTFDHILVKHWE